MQGERFHKHLLASESRWLFGSFLLFTTNIHPIQVEESKYLRASWIQGSESSTKTTFCWLLKKLQWPLPGLNLREAPVLVISNHTLSSEICSQHEADQLFLRRESGSAMPVCISWSVTHCQQTEDCWIKQGQKKKKKKVIPSIVIIVVCSLFCTLPATSWVKAPCGDVWGLNGACSLHLQIQCPSSQDQQKCRQIYWATASGTTLYHGFPSVYGLLFLRTQMLSECGFLQFWKCKFILYFQSRELLLSVCYSYQNKY